MQPASGPALQAIGLMFYIMSLSGFVIVLFIWASYFAQARKDHANNQLIKNLLITWAILATIEISLTLIGLLHYDFMRGY